MTLTRQQLMVSPLILFKDKRKLEVHGENQDGTIKSERQTFRTKRLTCSL